ncbi:RNA polymerase sigma factor [Pedobacter sp. P26]|uniref:RNA polymerase sigma factor n=1 Tax=Pedobacter sp. P26 TaxID=3423956 RepID=UPI003D67D53A
MSELIVDLRSSNEATFEQVFKIWHRKVYGYFISKTACTDLANELTQTVFIKLWRFRKLLSENYHLEHQIFRITKSVLIDYFRTENTARRHLSLYGKELEGSHTGENQFEIRQQLYTVLNTLPPMRKNVFILSKLYGYTYKEIAEQLSISPRTVENHVSLATKQLAKYSTLVLLCALLTIK